ncbi:MAG: Mur ligase family protein [Collinsella sp.]
MLAAVLAKRYRVWATKGNFNNLIGMPLTVLSAPADTEVLVLEMGMNHFHEIERLSQSANPNLAIVSKIGTSHIGILGSRENIARAKAEIVQGMCAAGDFLPLLVLGGEDDFTPFIRDTFAQPAGIDVMLAGVSDDDEVRARDIRVDDEGHPVFTLDFGQGDTVDTMLAIPGVQSVPNAVKAAAVAYRLGVTPEQIDAAFRGLTITGHRQEIKRAKSGARVIDDSYNASAESMLLASIYCARFRARGLAWRSWARWARWAMRLLACMSSWAPMPPPRSSTCWRAWVVSWPSLWPMPRA